jgi:hypothetical protein
MVVMMPPLSLSLRAILEEYGVLLSQLYRNSLLALAIFQYICEAFMGLHPSVPLFCYYYNARFKESSGAMTNVFTFHLHDGRGGTTSTCPRRSGTPGVRIGAGFSCWRRTPFSLADKPER